MIYFGCPKCQAAMAAPDGHTGQSETCPECGNVAVVPRPAASTAMASPASSVFDSLPPLASEIAASLEDGPLERPAERDDLPVSPWGARPAGISAACPRCQAEHTQKVSLAYATQTSHGSASGGGVAFSGGGMVPVIGGGSGSSQTLLAASLAPPTPRSDPSVLLALAGAALGGLVAVVAGAMMDAPTIFPAPALQGTLGGAIFAVFAGIGIVLHSGVKRHNRWVDATAPVWDRSWLCHRCGTVFVPHSHA